MMIMAGIASLPELAGVSEAEEFFEALGVPFDHRVLSVHRLHVLKRFAAGAAAFQRDHPEADEAELRAAVREALREAHERFARGAGPDVPGGRLVQRGGLVRLSKSSGRAR
jgi:nitrogenase-stabilizing/protective protein